MEKEDARYQTLQQLHERRKQVVRLHQRGIKVMELVQMTGLSYPAVRKVLDLFEQGDWAAIKPASRGRAKGDARLLTPQQEVHIQKTICDKRPEQWKMDFFLWSRGRAHGGQVPGTLGLHPTKAHQARLRTAP
jgi:transposase